MNEIVHLESVDTETVQVPVHNLLDDRCPVSRDRSAGVPNGTSGAAWTPVVQEASAPRAALGHAFVDLASVAEIVEEGEIRRASEERADALCSAFVRMPAGGVFE